MKLSKQAVGEFKSIWKEEFGEEISDKKALEQATSLLNLFRVISKPIPNKDNNGSIS